MSYGARAIGAGLIRLKQLWCRTQRVRDKNLRFSCGFFAHGWMIRLITDAFLAWGDHDFRHYLMSHN
jgi:hypothetical protein